MVSSRKPKHYLKRSVFIWYHYPLGDSYEEPKDENKNPILVEITVSEDSMGASFIVPENAKSGDTLHIILEGIDNGGTNPRVYQRIIVTVA